MKYLMGALVALILFVSPANAAFTITFDGGGVITDYFDKYTAVRQAGGKVIVDGPCISACTLIFTQIEPENVCITKRAIFGFHSASTVSPLTGREFSPDGTGMMWFSYPDYVQQFLIGKGWDGTKEHSELIWMDNTTASAFYKRCETQLGTND